MGKWVVLTALLLAGCDPKPPASQSAWTVAAAPDFPGSRRLYAWRIDTHYGSLQLCSVPKDELLNQPVCGLWANLERP